MLVPPTSTDRLSGRSRLPPQVGHAIATMYSSYCCRTESLLLSWYRRSTLLRIPSQLVSCSDLERAASVRNLRVPLSPCSRP